MSISANNLSDDECREISKEYDGWVAIAEAAETSLSYCLDLSELGVYCPRTQRIDINKDIERAESQVAELRDKLITDCPSWAEGI